MQSPGALLAPSFAGIPREIREFIIAYSPDRDRASLARASHELGLRVAAVRREQLAQYCSPDDRWQCEHRFLHAILADDPVPIAYLCQAGLVDPAHLHEKAFLTREQWEQVAAAAGVDANGDYQLWELAYGRTGHQPVLSEPLKGIFDRIAELTAEWYWGIGAGDPITIDDRFTNGEGVWQAAAIAALERRPNAFRAILLACPGSRALPLESVLLAIYRTWSYYGHIEKRGADACRMLPLIRMAAALLRPLPDSSRQYPHNPLFLPVNSIAGTVENSPERTCAVEALLILLSVGFSPWERYEDDYEGAPAEKTEGEEWEPWNRSRESYLQERRSMEMIQRIFEDLRLGMAPWYEP